jgi:hypothetical protein
VRVGSPRQNLLPLAVLSHTIYYIPCSMMRDRRRNPDTLLTKKGRPP